MSRAMTGGGNAQAFKVARVIQALFPQAPTSVWMPIVRLDGTLVMEVADMTSATSMQSAMQNAGMESSAAAATVQAMMREMH